jgi:hypothetical protein
LTGAATAGGDATRHATDNGKFQGGGDLMDDERDRERRDELPAHETRPEGQTGGGLNRSGVSAEQQAPANDDVVEAPSSDEPLPGEEAPADEEPAIDPDAPPPAYRFR